LGAVITVKSKISVIVVSENGILTVAGGAVNLASEGVFVSSKSSFSINSDNYFIVSSDGRTAKIKERIIDPATDLVFFKVELNNVPVISIGNSSDLKPGEKIFFVANSTQNSQVKFLASFVSFAQGDVERRIFEADRPSRTFGAQNVSPLVSGQSLINTKGELVGLWDGNNVISSDVLKHAIALYFANPAKIIRPSFGFSYSILNKTESAILNLNPGAMVKEVETKQGISPAAKDGLLKGDMIIKVNNEVVDEQNLLEEILQKYKPSDTLVLEIMRGKNKLNLSLKVGELK
jgi:serine protease DegS